MIEASVAEGQHGDIAIDDVTLTPGCKVKQDSSSTTAHSEPHVDFACDFESDLCSWQTGTNDPNNKFIWERMTLEECSSKHGDNCPGNEEGGNQGSFMYVAAEDNAESNIDATLISPPSQSDTADCFIFMYNLKVEQNMISTYSQLELVSEKFWNQADENYLRNRERLGDTVESEEL